MLVRIWETLGTLFHRQEFLVLTIAELRHLISRPYDLERALSRDPPLRLKLEVVPSPLEVCDSILETCIVGSGRWLLTVSSREDKTEGSTLSAWDLLDTIRHPDHELRPSALYTLTGVTEGVSVVFCHGSGLSDGILVIVESTSMDDDVSLYVKIELLLPFSR